MSESLRRFTVVCEDQVHAALAMNLADGVIDTLVRQRGDDWLTVNEVRRWTTPEGRSDVPENRRWHDIHAAPKVRIHGHLGGRPIGPGGRKLRAILVEHAQASPPPHLLLILQDTDGDRRLAKAAHTIMRWAERQGDLPACVIGMPHRDAEAWFMAIPDRTANEDQRLQVARQVLKFNPARQPERLTARPNDRVTDAKRVVRFVFLGEGGILTSQAPESKPPEPDKADQLANRLGQAIPQLRHHEECGLAGFIGELQRVLPDVMFDYLSPATG